MQNLVIALVFSGILADYIALSKTRILVRNLSRKPTAIRCVLIAGADMIASFFIFSIMALVTLVVMFTIQDLSYSNWDYNKLNINSVAQGVAAGYVSAICSARIIVSGETESGFFISCEPIAGAFFFSTMLTSIWLIFTMLSAIALKVLLPIEYVRRFTTWFFDVDVHPLRAMGTVAGGLILAASAIWSLIRAII